MALGTDSRVLAADSLSTVVTSPAAFRLTAPSGGHRPRGGWSRRSRPPPPPRSDDPLLAAAQAVIPATIEGVDVLARATGDVTPTQAVDATPATTPLTTAAQLIGPGHRHPGRRRRRRGHDTHANQPERHHAPARRPGRRPTRLLGAMADQGRADDVPSWRRASSAAAPPRTAAWAPTTATATPLFAIGPMG